MRRGLGLASYQPVLADDEQALGSVDLRQPHLLVEGAVTPEHHGNPVWEPSLGHLGGVAQHRRRQVMDLEAGLGSQRTNQSEESYTSQFAVFKIKHLPSLQKV